MAANHITTIESLHDYLTKAIQLEHATIPPYMMALYTIKPETNVDATNIIRVVLVEEMLHLTLAANVLNAVGGDVTLTYDGFMPEYPAKLPDGEEDFTVHLRHFSEETIDNFMKIERPTPPGVEGKVLIARERVEGALLDRLHGIEDGFHFYSIGDFYKAIENGLIYLENEAKAKGETIFTGDPSWQIGPKYYYSGGGKLNEVTDLESACTALELIMGQGEGSNGGIFDDDGEISHYYRFQQIKLGQYYQQTDKPDTPTGPTFDVDYEAAFPIKEDIRLKDLEGSPELIEAAHEFDKTYGQFLEYLTQAFKGKPDLFFGAVGTMFSIKNGVNSLIRNPLPTDLSLNAAPLFNVNPLKKSIEQ